MNRRDFFSKAIGKGFFAIGAGVAGADPRLIPQGKPWAVQFDDPSCLHCGMLQPVHPIWADQPNEFPQKIRFEEAHFEWCERFKFGGRVFDIEAKLIGGDDGRQG